MYYLMAILSASASSFGAGWFRFIPLMLFLCGRYLQFTGKLSSPSLCAPSEISSFILASLLYVSASCEFIVIVSRCSCCVLSTILISLVIAVIFLAVAGVGLAKVPSRFSRSMLEFVNVRPYVVSYSFLSRAIPCFLTFFEVIKTHFYRM